MTVLRTLTAVGLAATLLVGCNTDGSRTKGLVGTWTWKPRLILPSDAIRDETPDEEWFRFEADGHYLHVQKIPAYDVASPSVHVPEKFREWKGTWSIEGGQLEMTTDQSSWWAAVHDPKGWRTEEAYQRGDGYAYRLQETPKSESKLEPVATGDFARTLRRTTSPMPARPIVK